MIQLTERERALRTFKRQEIDRIAMVDSPWAGTLRRWKQEGLPENVQWYEHFGFDRWCTVLADNSPRFERKVLEENDRYKIVTTQWGGTQKVFNALDSTPEMLDYYCKTSDKWPEVKAKMQTFYEDRIPRKLLDQNYAKWKSEGRFVRLMLYFGFDVSHSRLTGTENMLIGMFEEPEWIMDIYDTYLTTSLELSQRMLDEGYEFDAVYFMDDMGYKGSPFFSPETYREILKPFHKRACDWAHERGMVVQLHSCGYIEPLIPDLLDAGIEMLNPLEVKAGMDPFRLKNLYGDRLAFHGGINAQLWDNIELVKAEMERIIPALKEGGGYVFASDHSIPNSVSFENMTQIAELAHRLGKY